MTRKKTQAICLILGMLFVKPIVSCAEINQTVKNFARSKIAIQYKFVLDQSLDTGPFSTTPGSEKRIYINKDRRYTIELLADKKNQIIHHEKLTFFYIPKSPNSENDKNCVISFIDEAAGGKINKDEFSKIYETALQSIEMKQIKKMNDFSVTVSIYHNAISNECEITITKT